MELLQIQQSLYFIINDFLFLLIFIILLLIIVFNNNNEINQNWIHKKQNNNKNIIIINQFLININIFILILLSFCYLDQFWSYYLLIFKNNIFYIELFFGQSYFNIFILFFKIIVNFFFLIYLIILKNYLHFKKLNFFNIIIFLPFSQLGIYGLLQANDLLSIYITLELIGISIYAIIAGQKLSNFSSEAALKYFIMSSFSTGLFLLGSSILYGFTGTINLNAIKLFLENIQINELYYITLLFATILIYSSLFFKFGCAPFHLWMSDIYSGCSIVVIIFLNILPKFSYYTLIVYLTIYTFQTFSNILNNFFLIVSLLSIIVGTFGALYQTKLKKIIAYSTINNSGFLFLGLSLHHLFITNHVTFFLISYFCLMINWFLLILGIWNYHTNKILNKINTLTNLISNNKILAIYFGIILISLSGLPPLFGFYIKFFILQHFFIIKYKIIGLFVVIFSLISSIYYLRIIKTLFFEKKKYFLLIKDLKFLTTQLIASITFFNFTILWFLNDIIIIFEYL